MRKITSKKAKCLAKVAHTMETSVLKIHVPVRITPCPPRLATLDFVDKGHPDRENDIQESQVLSKSCSYNGDKCH